MEYSEIFEYSNFNFKFNYLKIGWEEKMLFCTPYVPIFCQNIWIIWLFEYSNINNYSRICKYLEIIKYSKIFGNIHIFENIRIYSNFDLEYFWIFEHRKIYRTFSFTIYISANSPWIFMIL